GFERGFDDRAFDTASGHRSQESTIVTHGDLTAGRARRGTPGLNHGTQRDLVAGGQPSRCNLQLFVHYQSFGRGLQKYKCQEKYKFWRFWLQPGRKKLQPMRSVRLKKPWIAL